jgi:hypothetical protein
MTSKPIIFEKESIHEYCTEMRTRKKGLKNTADHTNAAFLSRLESIDVLDSSVYPYQYLYQYTYL